MIYKFKKNKWRNSSTWMYRD